MAALRVLVAALLLGCSAGADVPFEAFNDLMKDVQLIVPNMTLMSNLYAHLVLDKDGSLQNISIDDMTVTPKVVSGTEVTVTVELKEVHGVLAGPMGLRVLPGLVTRHGDGSFSASVKSLELDLTFHSNDTTTLPPTDVDGKVHLKGLKLGMHCKGPLLFLQECGYLETLLGAADALGGLIENWIVNIILKKVIPDINKVVHELGEDIAASEVPVPPFPNPTIAEEANINSLTNAMNLNNSLVKVGELVVDKVFNVKGTGPNADRLVINELVDKLVPYGIISVNTSELSPIVVKEGPVRVEVQVQAFTVLGVDDFTDFNLLNVTANHTVQTELAFAEMRVALPLAVTVTVDESVVVGGGKFTFDLDTNVTLSGSAKLALIAGVDGQQLMSIEHGSLKRSPLACVSEAVDVLNMTYLTIDAQELKVNVFTEFMAPTIPNSGGFNTLLGSLLQTVSTLYVPSVSRTLPMLSLLKATPVVNSVLEKIVNSTAPCLPPQPGAADDYIDFSKSSTIELLNFVTNDVLGDLPSDMDINHVSAVLLDAVASGSPTWNGTAFVHDGSISIVVDKVGYGSTPAPVHIGYLNLTIGNMTVQPMGSFSDFVILTPNGTHQLDTHIKGPGVKVSIDLNLTWIGYGDSIRDWSHVDFEIDGLDLGIDVAMLIYGDEYELLQLNQSSDLSCLYPAMGPHGLRLPVTSASVDSAYLMLQCYECTGKVFYTWTEKLKTAAAQNAITESVNYILREAMGVLQSDKAQEHLDIRQEQAVCGEAFPPSQTQVTTENDGGWWFRFSIMFMLPLVAVLLMVSYSVYRVRQALDPSLEGNFLTEESVCGDEYEVDDDISTFAGETRWDSLRMSESIAMHPAVPRVFARLFPILIFSLLAVLLSAQMYYASIGIDSSVTVAGQTKYITMYNYSTYKFCRDGFNAGGLMLFLALCIGVASGAWAWIRIFLLIWAFYVPPTVLSHKYRTFLLEFLDYTAKWALIDPCLNLFFIPMVNLDTYPPGDWAAWTDSLAGLDVFVDTLYGFFGFFGYQIMALIVGQFVLFYDRNVVASVRAEIRSEQAAAIEGRMSSGRSAASGASSVRSYATTTWFKEGAEDTRRESLRAHMHTQFDYLFSCLFVHPEQGEKRSRISLPGRCIIAGGLLGCITVVIIGAVIPFVGVENKGVINDMIYITPGAEVQRTYTMYHMAKLFISAAPSMGAEVLHGIVCVGIMVCVVVVPIIEFVLLIGMWFIPLTLTEHKMFFALAEVAASWSLLDVFTVATFAITVCVHHLLAFVVGNKLDAVDDKLNWMQDWGFVGSTSRIAAADGVWVSGFFFLAAGALVSNLIYIALFSANKHAIRDREKIAYAVWASRTRSAEDSDDAIQVACNPKSTLIGCN